GESGDPGFVSAAAGADFSDDDEGFGIGVQGLANDLVGDVGPVVVAGIDVVDAGGDGVAEDAHGGFGIARRTPDLGAGELHGSVAESVEGKAGSGEGKGAAEVR